MACIQDDGKIVMFFPASRTHVEPLQLGSVWKNNIRDLIGPCADRCAAEIGDQGLVAVASKKRGRSAGLSAMVAVLINGR